MKKAARSSGLFMSLAGFLVFVTTASGHLTFYAANAAEDPARMVAAETTYGPRDLRALAVVFLSPGGIVSGAQSSGVFRLVHCHRNGNVLHDQVHSVARGRGTPRRRCPFESSSSSLLRRCVLDERLRGTRYSGGGIRAKNRRLDRFLCAEAPQETGPECTRLFLCASAVK